MTRLLTAMASVTAAWSGTAARGGSTSAMRRPSSLGTSA